MRRILDGAYRLLPPGARGFLESLKPDWASERVRRAGLVLCALTGALAGLGGFTFHYAKGTSYLSNDPRVCVNCHIMRDEYDSWGKSSHHAVAGCVDCHLPHAIVPKMIAKAENGYHHSKAFTLQDFHEPITIKGRNSRILQDSCIRCHADVTHSMRGHRSQRRGDLSCVHCHRGVGHGVPY
jgi:cytochrome c nitrite reductase small subunit